MKKGIVNSPEEWGKALLSSRDRTVVIMDSPGFHMQGRSWEPIDIFDGSGASRQMYMATIGNLTVLKPRN